MRGWPEDEDPFIPALAGRRHGEKQPGWGGGQGAATLQNCPFPLPTVALRPSVPPVGREGGGRGQAAAAAS